MFHNPADKAAEMAGHTIGSSMSLATTATGQAICAFLPSATQEQVLLASKLSKTEHDELTRHLTETAAQGFALKDISPQGNLRALGVPAFNLNGEVAGALSVVFLADRYDDAQIRHSLVPHLQRCATYLVSAL